MNLPYDVGIAFKKLGELQRDKPEIAMIRAQHIMGGGVYITHRLSHLAYRGTVLGYEKVIKTLNWLNSEYGFEREMQENIKSNARYHNVDPNELAKKIKDALAIYAKEHSKLPVYNKVQWRARQAAIFVGLERFEAAKNCLQLIMNMCPTQDEFRNKSLEFTRNPDGSLKEYTPEILKESIKDTPQFIKNPNSSGQGFHPEHNQHPFHDVLLKGSVSL